MSAIAVSRKEWSAATLAFLASFTACTVSAIAALIFMEKVHLHGITWAVSSKVFAVIFCYMQLVASTMHHSPVERKGNVIEGMIYSDLGDDYVRTTVGWWMVQWFISVLCWSAAIGTIGIVIISAMQK